MSSSDEPATRADQKTLDSLFKDLTALQQINKDDLLQRLHASIALIKRCIEVYRKLGGEAFKDSLCVFAEQAYHFLANSMLAHFSPGTDPEIYAFPEVSFTKFPVDQETGHSTRPTPINAADQVLQRKYLIESWLDTIFARPDYRIMPLIHWGLEACVGKRMFKNHSDFEGINNNKKITKKVLKTVQVIDLQAIEDERWKEQVWDLVMVLLRSLGEVLARTFEGEVVGLWGNRWVFVEGRGILQGDEVEGYEDEGEDVESDGADDGDESLGSGEDDVGVVSGGEGS